MIIDCTYVEVDFTALGTVMRLWCKLEHKYNICRSEKCPFRRKIQNNVQSSTPSEERRCEKKP
jgi:hypothetical protein